MTSRSSSLAKPAAPPQDDPDSNPKASRRRVRMGYTLKRSGKVVSGPQSHRRALVLLSQQLTLAGSGGGIVTLMLPTGPREQRRLELDAKGCRVELVRLRNKGVRGEIRESAMSAELICLLVALCPAKPTWKKRHFVLWLIDEIKKQGSPAYNLLARVAPDLLESDRGYWWWYRLLGKKMSR
jgi:hypothetical protein